MNEQLSAEQLEARREEMKQFYESSVPYLEAQAKYERLLTEVEEARYKRATMQLQYATMMAATQPSENDENEPTISTEQAPSGSKKLKRN
jgi:hypothetical protein